MKVETKEKSHYTDIEDIDISYDDDGVVDDVPEPARQLSLEEGFWKTREKCGYVDLRYWSSVTDYKMDDIIHLANGIFIWQDPVRYELNEDRYESWITREEMLTGNLIEKYHKTEKIHQKTGLFEENLKLLKANLPEEVLEDEIYIGMGAVWLKDITLKGVGVYSAFLSYLLETKDIPEVNYLEYTGHWSVHMDSKPDDILNHIVYGTSRISALKIAECLLNQSPVKVTDPVEKADGNGTKYVLNETETLLAQQKAELIRERWNQWIKMYMPELVKAYMEHFGYGIATYDGGWLDFKDSPKCKLHPYQKDAVAQILASKNTFLGDEVGSGKTYEYTAGVHKLLELGLAKKALITAPNDTVKASYELYLDLFPNDKVLFCNPKGNFNATHREETLEEIKNGEYEVIFMPHSSLDQLTLSRKYKLRKLQMELRECNAYLEQLSSYEQRHQMSLIYKAKKKKIDKWKESFEDSYKACFEKLGFDTLVIDEVHNYKNISIAQFRGANVIGCHTEGSKKADNLVELVRYIQKGQGHVIFATGTPVTNSLADIYTWQYYLQPQELKASGTYFFSSWLATFARETQDYEVDLDGKSIRLRTRYSSFQNLPELMKMFAAVSHFHKVDKKEAANGLPEFEKYTDIVVKRSENQRKYIEELAKRTEMIRAGVVNPKEDNLLKVTVDGRKVALDERLAGIAEESYIHTEQNKVFVCATKLAEVYQRYPGTRQAVFLDISTPKEGFNLYDELKKEAVKKGIPAKEIAFIQEADSLAKRKKLEKAFNAGEVRILIGSTLKLGTGTNIQEHLIAVHHFDIPWRPADFIQRNGRIIRQGNRNSRVEIFRYITEGTFDAYLYQLIEKKQEAVSRFLEGSALLRREEEDCSDLVLNYSEIKALAMGDSLMKRHFEISNTLGHMKIARRERKKELLRLQEAKDRLPQQIRRCDAQIRRIEEDMKHYHESKEVIPREERIAFGEELISEMKRNLIHKERVFDTYQGFKVILPAYTEREKPFVYIENQARYKVNMKDTKVQGCTKRIDHVLEHLKEKREMARFAMQKTVQELESAKKELEKGNSYDATVEALKEKLREVDQMIEEQMKEEEEQYERIKYV